jgi:MinD-like ATPase involved in chromosome partitioning or flagellar assembly
MFGSESIALLRKRGPNKIAEPITISISGPYGSSGKTTVAINLALELAAERAKVLLIDADLQGGSIANHFMLSELPAGLPGALRLASQNRLDYEQLERLSVSIAKSSARLLPAGQPIGQSIDRQSLLTLLQVAKQSFDYTVIDLSSLKVVEQSKPADPSGSEVITEELFGLADRQIVVCLADPVGIFRLLAQESQILASSEQPLLLINRVRNSVIAGAKSEIGITLQRLSELPVAAYLPDDPGQLDQALRTGVPAVALSRSGAFRQGITGFVRAEILGSKGRLDSRVAKLG